jgi:hypothetical protein
VGNVYQWKDGNRSETSAFPPSVFPQYSNSEKNSNLFIDEIIFMMERHYWYDGFWSRPHSFTGVLDSWNLRDSYGNLEAGGLSYITP